MKNINIFILLVSIILVVFSCEDDKETIVLQSGVFTIDGVEYEMGHGEILRFEPAHGAYGCPFYFLCNNYEFTQDDVSGVGQTAEGFVWSDTDVYMKSGTYNLFDENNPQSTTFHISFFNNWDISSWHMDFIYQSKSGTLEVSRDGEVYELFFDVLTDKYEMESTMNPKEEPIETDIRVTLTYSGTLAQKYFE